MSSINSQITVIVPMFNEEQNIENCVRILQAQTVQNFNVIFIDDGSTDDTVECLITYLENNLIHFDYKIIQQKNRGAAKAREVAIRKSLTPYVLVFDTDDHITADTIDLTNQVILKYQPDISLPNFQIEQADGTYNMLQYPDNKMEFSGLEALSYTLGKWEVPGIMCAKKELFLKSYELYRQYNPKDLNYMNNDEVISRFNFYFSDKIIRNQSSYTYQYNENSTTKKINSNRYLMANNVQILYQCFKQESSEGISYKVREEYINVLWGLIKYVRRHGKELPNRAAWVAQIRELVDFIRPELSTFKFKSFKMISRKWLSLLLTKLL